MVDPILHSVAEPPKNPQPLEVQTINQSVNPRIAELLQSIYSVSRTAATSISLGKAVDSAKDLQSFIDPGDVLEFSLDAGHEAVNKVWSDTEELARLLDVDLEKPISYRLKPVFADK
jgi:hypothetical protein